MLRRILVVSAVAGSAFLAPVAANAAAGSPADDRFEVSSTTSTTAGSSSTRTTRSTSTQVRRLPLGGVLNNLVDGLLR